jgi:hypothetical protein
MRMWMVDPKTMCRKHLLGEHVEIHMIVGHMKRKKSIRGFVKNNCIEPSKLLERHQELVEEMIYRGYKHKSSLEVEETLLDYLTSGDREVKVDVGASLEDILARCAECRSRS